MKQLTGVWKILAGVLVVVLLAGPRVRPHELPASMPMPTVPTEPTALQAWVDAHEKAAGALRPDNQARIVWADPAHPARTACAMVYLHGFGASQGEGDPVHRELAKTFGCNLYLSRMPGHGLVAPDAMRGLKVQQLWDASVQALAIGHALGDKVIVLGTSMGGGLALDTAAMEPGKVDALVLWSPFVRERGDRLSPLLWPWGATGMKYRINHGSDLVPNTAITSIYWAQYTHLDGYRAMTDLSRGAQLPSTFQRVTVPVFVGYYYRDEQNQDPTVSVAAILKMYDELGTPADKKRKVDFPDADSHVIVSPIRSKASEQVFAASRDFLQQVVGLVPVH